MRRAIVLVLVSLGLGAASAVPLETGMSASLRGGQALFLTKAEDASGNVTTIARRPAGCVQNVSAGGRGMTMSHYSLGFVSRTTDGAPRTTFRPTNRIKYWNKQ